MIDISGIEFDFLPQVLWTVLPVVGLIVLGILINSLTDYEVVAPFVIAIFWLVIGGIAFLLVTPNLYVDGVQREIIKEQLTEQGHERISLSGDQRTFISEHEGKYFDGILAGIGNYQYKIVEIPK